MDIFEEVYDSAKGELLEEFRLDWVRNQFTPGSPCDLAYGEMLDAYARLRDRLGVGDEDPDVEIMRDCQDRITYQLCRELFRSGMVYQQKRQRLPGPQG